MTATHRSRWLGTMLALIALVLGLSTASVAATTPAQAAPGSSLELCFPVVDPATGQIVDWICVPIPVEQDPCPGCPDFAIGFDHLIIPTDPWYVEDLALGLELLGQAARTDDRREAARFRAQATSAFLAAAERLGDTRIQLAEVGFVDRENQVIEPEPHPWLVSAGTDLAGGLTMMQQAVTSPEPTPWIAAGMARFDAAFDALAQQRPGR